MFKSLIRSVPLPSNHVVASVAIGSKACSTVVWAGGGLVLVAVATVTFGIDDVKAFFRTRNVTPLTFGCAVHANQRETTMLMDFPYFGILDQPRFRCMASSTVGTYRLLVYVGVASGTFRRRFRKIKRWVTFPTTHHFVLANQRKICFVVIKVFRLYIVPIFCRMTITAFQLEIFPMRRLNGKASKCQKQADYEKIESNHRMGSVISK